jgi:hypothetical protein
MARGLLVLLFLAAGCWEEDGTTDGGRGGEPDVIIGEGDGEGVGFQAFEEGGIAHLVGGPQGGYHFWFGARVRGLDPDGLVFVIQGFRDDLDGALANQFTTTILMVDSHEDGYWQTAEPVTMILCPSPQGIGADDKDYRVAVTVRDSLGRSVEDEVGIHTVCPDDDRCATTCAGD